MLEEITPTRRLLLRHPRSMRRVSRQIPVLPLVTTGHETGRPISKPDQRRERLPMRLAIYFDHGPRAGAAPEYSLLVMSGVEDFNCFGIGAADCREAHLRLCGQSKQL